MVVLENVDLEKLDLNTFRSYTCPCELCDCGCFERSRESHHLDCKRNTKYQLTLNSDRRAKPCMLTHYKATFNQSTYDGKPAETYRPPPDVNNLTPFLSQWTPDFNSVTNISFKPFQITERTKPAKVIDSVEMSTEPMNGLSETRAEFQPLKTERIQLMKGAKSMIKIPGGKFSSDTTTAEYYKDWKADKPEKGYYNYPSVAGDHIFPSNEREFSTYMKATYVPKAYSKVDSVNKNSNHGTLKPEGDMDMDTNYKTDFVLFKDAERARLIDPDRHSKKVLSTSLARAAVTGITQNKIDFKNYPNHRPPPPANVNPYESYLNHQLYPGKKADHTTMYKAEYQGIDVSKVPKAVSYKQVGTYEKPTEKVQGETETMREYKPIDLSLIPSLKATKREGKIKIPAGPMESVTMSKLQFPAYDVQPVRLAGNPEPAFYAPPTIKFGGESWTMATYRGEKGERNKAIKAPEGNIKIDRDEKLDAVTNYKDAFIKHGLSICEHKALKIVIAREERNKINGNLSRPRSLHA